MRWRNSCYFSSKCIDSLCNSWVSLLQTDDSRGWGGIWIWARCPHRSSGILRLVSRWTWMRKCNYRVSHTHTDTQVHHTAWVWLLIHTFATRWPFSSQSHWLKSISKLCSSGHLAHDCLAWAYLSFIWLSCMTLGCPQVFAPSVLLPKWFSRG